MQKVDGSSPFIRSPNPLETAGFLCPVAQFPWVSCAPGRSLTFLSVSVDDGGEDTV